MCASETASTPDKHEDHSGLQPPQKKDGNVIFALLVVLFSGFLLLNIGSQTKWIDGIRLLDQPRFWPAVSLSCMFFFAVAYLFQSLQGVKSYKASSLITEFWQPQELLNWLRTVEYVIYFLLYIIGAQKIGYLPATILFCPLMTFRAGYRNKKILGLTILVGISIVLIFKTFLQVKLPAGEMYYLLPDQIGNIFIRYF